MSIITVLKLSSLISMTNKELFNFDYNLSIDVLWLVKEMYPGLDDNEVQTIAYEIVSNYDYSLLADELHLDLQDTAERLNISLEDKDIPNEVSHLIAI